MQLFIKVGVMKMGENSMTEMTVDAVVRQLNVTPRTLRYYEEIGLIKPCARSSGGHRLYNQANVEHVKQIMGLKEVLGFSLDEIREILDAERSLDSLRDTFRQAKENLDTQMTVVDTYIRLLEDLIRKMDAKIENIASMRTMYQERLERSLRFREEHSNDA